MTYVELFGGTPIEKVKISDKIKIIATLQIPLDIASKIAFLFIDTKNVQDLYPNIEEQYKAIDEIVLVVSRLLLQILTYRGINYRDIEKIKLFLVISLKDYVEKHRLESMIKDILFDDTVIKYDPNLTKYIKQYLINIVRYLHSLRIDTKYPIPSLSDVIHYYKSLDNYNGWVVYKHIGNNILLLALIQK